MTVIVGLLCKDGIVIGADSSATFGPDMAHKTIEQTVQKVFVVQGRIIIAGTGQVGTGQRFTAAVDSAWLANAFSKDHTPTEFAKKLCNIGITDFGSTQMNKGCFGSLVAFPVKGKLCLCELALSDFQPELKVPIMWFASMGSGQPITDPFLGLMRRVFYPNEQPTVKEGLFLTTWALMHTIELNPGGINGPPQVAKLTLNSKGEPEAHILTDDELEEHKNNVESAEKHLSQYRQILNSPPIAGEPTLPTK
jgi:proteasome subunit B (beta)-like protein